MNLQIIENEVKNSYTSSLSTNEYIFISAKNKLNLNKLKDLLYNKVRSIHVQRYPYDNFLYPD